MNKKMLLLVLIGSFNSFCMEQLPLELHIQILNKLSPEDIRSMEALNSYWCNLVNSEHTTKVLIKNLEIKIPKVLTPVLTACILKTKGAWQWLKAQKPEEIQTSWLIAARQRKNNIVSLFLDKNLVKVNYKGDDSWDCTALDIASIIFPNPGLVRLLLQKGADPKISRYNSEAGLLNAINSWSKIVSDEEERKEYEEVADLIQYHGMASLFDEKNKPS